MGGGIRVQGSASCFPDVNTVLAFHYSSCTEAIFKRLKLAKSLLQRDRREMSESKREGGRHFFLL